MINPYFTLSSQSFHFYFNLILGCTVTNTFIQSFNSSQLIVYLNNTHFGDAHILMKLMFNETHYLFQSSVIVSKLIVIVFYNDIIFHDIFQAKTTFLRWPLKTAFLILVLRTKKGHISSHGELLGALPRAAAPGPKLVLRATTST